MVWEFAPLWVGVYKKSFVILNVIIYNQVKMALTYLWQTCVLSQLEYAQLYQTESEMLYIY